MILDRQGIEGWFLVGKGSKGDSWSARDRVYERMTYIQASFLVVIFGSVYHGIHTWWDTDGNSEVLPTVLIIAVVVSCYILIAPERRPPASLVPSKRLGRIKLSPFIKWFDDAAPVETVGGKAANLSQCTRAGSDISMSCAQ